MGLLVAGLSWIWNRLSLEDVTYERTLSQQRVFIDEEVTMSVTLTNRKPMPLGRIRVEDEIPDIIEIADAPVVGSHDPQSQTLQHSTSMAWYERIHWQYKIKCPQRGFYRLGPTRLYSGDLFGFFSSEKLQRGNDYLLVYPRIVPLPELGLPFVRPLGETKGGLRIYEDPARPVGLRDYQLGDPLKIVDWKATARMQQLQVRTYEPSSSITVIVAVAIDTAAHYWEGYHKVNLERVITTAASVANYANEQQYSIGLFSNGTPVLADRPMKIPPSQSPEQLTAILEALATIRPIAMGSMSDQLSENSRRFPIGSTIVIVTAFLPDELGDVINTLREQGYKIVVLYVGTEETPQLPEDVIFHQLAEYFERLEYTSEFSPR